MITSVYWGKEDSGIPHLPPELPRELRGLPPPRDRNREYGLERMAALEERKRRLRGRGGPWGRGGF